MCVSVYRGHGITSVFFSFSFSVCASCEGVVSDEVPDKPGEIIGARPWLVMNTVEIR